MQRLIFAQGGKGLLHPGLAVVKIPPHRADLHIGAGLGAHLQLLDLRNAPGGVEYEDPGAGHVVEALQGGLARVAGGGGQNHGLPGQSLLPPPRGDQPGQQGEGHVLEGGGGAPEKLQHIVLPHGHQGGQLRGLKLSRVGLPHQLAHPGKARQQIAQDLFRPLQGRAGEAGPPVEGPGAQLLFHKQAAVGGQALQHGAEIVALIVGTRTLYQHKDAPFLRDREARGTWICSHSTSFPRGNQSGVPLFPAPQKNEALTSGPFASKIRLKYSDVQYMERTKGNEKISRSSACTHDGPGAHRLRRGQARVRCSR